MPTQFAWPVHSMTRRGVWCWTCQCPSAFEYPILVEDNYGYRGVHRLRCCEGCGTEIPV